MRFFKLEVGATFSSNKFSDPDRLVRYEKVGDDFIHDRTYLQVVLDIVHYGNARRKTDGMLFKFLPEDEVLTSD